MRAACSRQRRSRPRESCARSSKLVTLDVSQPCIGPNTLADFGQSKVADLLSAPPLSALQALTAALMLVSSSAAYPAARAVMHTRP